MAEELKTNNMSYKQSPFPMIEGTSPVKSLSLAKFAIKYGVKGYKYIKNVMKGSKKAISKSKQKPHGKQYMTRHPQTGKIHQPRITTTGHTRPGVIHPTHEKFIGETAKRLEASRKYWYNPLKK